MRLAFSTLGCPAWTIEQASEAAVRYGYDAIEWRLADGQMINSSTEPEIIGRIKQATKQAGLAIACLDTSCQFVQASPEQRRKTVAEAKAMVDMAAALEAPLLRVFGGPIAEGLNRAELMLPTAEALSAVADYAAPKGVKVLLETHDDWSRSADALALIEAALASQAANGQTSSALAVLWDVHHPYRMGETPRQTFANLQKLLAHVHIKDARPDPTARTKWRLTLLEVGEVPVREVVSLLQEAGYQGYLSVEWEKKWHPDIEEPEIALPQFAKLLRSYLSN